MDKIEIIKMAQVELPKYTETYMNNTDWVKYGYDNQFPIMLQELANRSALHNAIIVSKVDNICGLGLKYEKNKDSKTDAFLQKANPNETLEDIIKKITFDYVLYGGYALNYILSRDKKSIAEVYHIDFANIRSGKADSKGVVNEYYYSEDWTNYRKSQYAPKLIPAYSESSKEPSQLMYVKEYRPGIKYYPLPAYVGAMAYINIDCEVSNFHLAHIKNGMQPSTMINFLNGIPTDEERKQIERSINEKYTGSDNAGKFILTFSDDASKAPVVTSISSNDLDKQFIQLQDTVLQNILSGHRIVSPALVGIKTPGQLGSTQELETSHQLFVNGVIKPAQNLILKTINQIGSINGLQPLEIIPIKPIEFSWSENILEKLMSLNEMRDAISLDPLPEGETPLIPQQTVQPTVVTSPIQ